MKSPKFHLEILTDLRPPNLALLGPLYLRKRSYDFANTLENWRYNLLN